MGPFLCDKKKLKFTCVNKNHKKGLFSKSFHFIEFEVKIFSMTIKLVFLVNDINFLKAIPSACSDRNGNRFRTD